MLPSLICELVPMQVKFLQRLVLRQVLLHPKRKVIRQKVLREIQKPQLVVLSQVVHDNSPHYIC